MNRATTRPAQLLVGLAFIAFSTFGVTSCSSDEDGTTGDTLPSLPTDGRVTPGNTYQVEFGTHCGVERLGLNVNGVSWITDEANGIETDWMPAEWAEDDGGLIPLEIVLSSDGTELRAEASGRTVTYRPLESSDPEKFCE